MEVACKSSVFGWFLHRKSRIFFALVRSCLRAQNIKKSSKLQALLELSADVHGVHVGPGGGQRYLCRSQVPGSIPNPWVSCFTLNGEIKFPRISRNFRSVAEQGEIDRLP